MRNFKLLVLLAVLGAPIPLHAQVVQGRLLESGTRRPVVSAMISLVDSSGVVVQEAMSGMDGSFRIQAPEPGAYFILAEGLGYAPFLDGVELGEGGFLPVELFLEPQPIMLDSIVATISRVQTIQYLKTIGYYQRMQSGFGHFITPEEIADRPFFDIGDRLRTVPRVSTSTGFLGTEVRMRGSVGYCVPRIMVDGLEVSVGGSAVIDQTVASEDIAAMEIYAGVAQLPFEYSSINTCGVILIWTKGSHGG